MACGSPFGMKIRHVPDLLDFIGQELAGDTMLIEPVSAQIDC
jgi:hypothetical protein